VYSINNYTINKSLIFYPLNGLEQHTISLKNNRLITVNNECKICKGDIYAYECDQCSAGISKKFLTITPPTFRALILIENNILDELKLLDNKKYKFLDKKNFNDLIKYLQNILIKRKKVDCNLLNQLIDLNKKWYKCNEISYYISKCINLIDHKLVFLLKLYELIVNLALSNACPHNFYYYDFYKKYEFLIKEFQINLPISFNEFKKLYENIPDYVGSFLNFYSDKKSYPLQSISAKNYYYGLNFETIAECRSIDSKISYLNTKIETKLTRNLRDKIRAEFGLKKINLKKEKIKIPKLEINLNVIDLNERRNNV